MINLGQSKLDVISPDGSISASFPVIYGRNSHLGTKEREGDQRTPRGKYYVCTINGKSWFTLFFGLSYPGREDAHNAHGEGRIALEALEEIIGCIDKMKRPPWDTPLGGQIGIHGGGIDRDGTRGCIGMKDEDVLKLAEYVKMGTPVVIL